MLHISPKDTNKKCLMNNGEYATIISVIKENGNLCIVLGRYQDQIIIWDDRGYTGELKYNIIGILHE
jgi:hypothetical protein